MIYLDNNATTAVDEQVLEAMLPYFREKFGNASSNLHTQGWIAKDAVEQARLIIADSIACTPQEIVFTSGATEALNTAIIGVYNAYHSKGNHIVTIQTEHNAVLDTCKYLAQKGADITYLKVDKNGQIDLNELENSITNNTVLVAAMLVNNETGVILPIKEISKIVHQKNSILCCDTTQAFGKIPIHVDEFGIDLMSISGHKCYAPKGVGALYVRRKNPRVTIEALLHGGGHENGKRSGTLNVPGIVALGKATQIAYENLLQNTTHISSMRNLLENKFEELLENKIEIVGKNTSRIYNTSNIIFPTKSENIIKRIKHKIAISTGSACTSAENKPSHVLKAMDYSDLQAQSALRFSIGKYNTLDDIHQTIQLFKEIDL